MLIAEDLLLLLLDDEKGTTSGLWVDAAVPLAAAVLAELGVDGAVDLEPGSVLTSAKLRATGVAPDDPLLGDALAVVAEKPRSPSALVGRIGPHLRERLLDRLVQQGLVERRETRVLGLFPRDTWPATSSAHEREVRDRLREVLLQDAEPDARDAVLAGILGALDRIPATLEVRGADAAAAKRRAKAIAKGDWASKAVSDAVQATVVAVMVPVIAATTVTTT